MDIIDPELEQMLAKPEFVKDPLHSKEFYLEQTGFGFLHLFLRLMHQPKESFEQIQKTHVDEYKICFETQTFHNGKNYVIASWVYDLGNQEAPDKSRQRSFFDRAQKKGGIPGMKIYNPSPDKPLEHVLLRKVYTIQIETDEKPFTPPIGGQFARLKDVGWCVVELIHPSQKPPGFGV